MATKLQLRQLQWFPTDFVQIELNTLSFAHYRLAYESLRMMLCAKSVGNHCS